MLCQGMTLVMPQVPQNEYGFSRWGFVFIESSHTQFSPA
jgi:hypothetical protein